MDGKKKGENAKGRTNALERRRRVAGTVAMVAGAPNLILSAILFLSAAIGTIVLCYILGDMIFGDNGDDPWLVFIIIILVIVIIIVLIILLIALVVLAILLMAFSGQVVGGLLARRGRRFGLSVALLTCGTIVSFLFGSIAALVAIGGEMNIWIRVALVLWGLYSVASSIVTGLCTFTVVGAKDTFTRPTPKKKGRSRRSK